MDNNEDICGFCGKPGADKVPHPVRGGLAKKTLEQSTCTQSARTLNADGHTSFFRIENVKVSYALFDV